MTNGSLFFTFYPENHKRLPFFFEKESDSSSIIIYIVNCYA